MRPVEEARAEIVAAFEPVGTERVALCAALGRFSAEPVFARHALPPFDQSAMDGYAVRAQELASASPNQPVALRCVGESRAGGPSPPALAPQTAMRIFTGAMLPPLADAVVIQEDTERCEHGVNIRAVVRPFDHVRRVGSDLTPDALCIGAGTLLGGAELGLLASQDLAQVTVFRRPRVAILCTGDELREVGDPDRPGSVVNSNALTLSAQVAEAGGDPWLFPNLPDDRARLGAAIELALRADVVLLSGGVSVGEYDLVRAALGDAGIALDLWKVRMKPGKPVAFGRHGRIPVLGLPGNPVSSWVTFELFARPGLRKMLGDPHPFRPTVEVRLARPLSRSPGRVEFARARLARDRTGPWVAHLAPNQGSGSLPSLVGVDALVVIPADCTTLDDHVILEAQVLRLPY